MSEESKQTDMPAIPEETRNGQPAQATGKIAWLDKDMQSSYANVVNVATTEDEFMFLFGTNEAWNSVQKDIKVNLHHRIIMTPNCARRLQLLLNKTIEEYDKKRKP